MLRVLPPGLLNALYPHLRVLHQLLSLLLFTLWTPVRSLLRQRAEQPALARGRVVNVAASWHRLPKRPLRAGFACRTGLLGDKQGSAWLASWGGHGGLEKAVCIFDAGVLRQLQSDGHPITPGSIGEQLLLDGLVWGDAVRTGAVLAVGPSIVLEVTEPAMPCGTIRSSFLKGNNSAVDARKFPGCSRWYARVLSDGWVKPGDEVRLLRLPKMTAAEAVADVARKLKGGEPILETGEGSG